MTNLVNRQVRLKSRPTGIPQAEHFELTEEAVPDLEDGEVLIRNVFLSVDPAMRGWVSTEANYAEPVGTGEVMRSFAAGEVVASTHPQLEVGHIVVGLFGWQHYAVSNGGNVTRVIQERDLPLSASLGVLGLNGVTAYFGLLEVGQPEPADTVLVSTAAGAVGSCVGQIAKIKGCRVVGLTGSDDKVAQCIEEFGFDAAINYKTVDDLAAAIGGVCPGGIDIYFDNTAGAISDAVVQHINVGARIVVCGTASVASWDPWPHGPRIERHLLVKRARMQGFVVLDYFDRYDEAVERLSGWLRGGFLKNREDILEGLEQRPTRSPGCIGGRIRESC